MFISDIYLLYLFIRLFVTFIYIIFFNFYFFIICLCLFFAKIEYIKFISWCLHKSFKKNNCSGCEENQTYVTDWKPSSDLCALPCAIRIFFRISGCQAIGDPKIDLSIEYVRIPIDKQFSTFGYEFLVPRATLVYIV